MMTITITKNHGDTFVDVKTDVHSKETGLLTFEYRIYDYGRHGDSGYGVLIGNLFAVTELSVHDLLEKAGLRVVR